MASTPSPGRRRVLRVSRSLSLPVEELQWRFTTGGGPGGQHANKASTRVELVFDVQSSPSLGPRQRARLLEKVGPSVRVVSREHRSQALNRDDALDRLADKLSDALRVEAPRRPTTPSAGARARRLEAKRRQAQRKKSRALGRVAEDQ